MMICIMMVVVAVAVAAMGIAAAAAAMRVWRRMEGLRGALAAQGMRGPAPAPMVGNFVSITREQERELSADLPAASLAASHRPLLRRLLPFYLLSAKTYGKRFVFWEGSEPRIVLTEPELIREVFSAKCALSYGKSYIHQRCCEHFLGNGVVMANGEAWARQRRIIAPAFHINKLKALAGVMQNCAEAMIEKWEAIVASTEQKEAEVEVEVYDHLRKLTADIISRTEFGSSYDKGKRIFDLLTSLQRLTLRFAHFVWIPGSRFLPTSWNWEMWRLKREMERLMTEIIKERKDVVRTGRMKSYGEDLLGLLLKESEGGGGGGGDGDGVAAEVGGGGGGAGGTAAAHKQFKYTTQLVMDECKTFFFAGHETSAGLLSWAMLLMAVHPEWQDMAREEVMQVMAAGGGGGDGAAAAADHLTDSLHKLKVLGMIINETLRLYPPAIVITRYALMDMQLGDMFIPKDASVWIPILAIHLDEELWGEDAHFFKPQRFEHGIARACKHPFAYMPFAFGPRNCVGQGFALMEAKIVLSMILQKFSFRLSPTYRHAPVTMLTLKPNYGAQLILRRI